MSVIINPGTGPVGGADYDTALGNMWPFVLDLIDAGHEVSPKVEHVSGDDYGDGRFCFRIWVDGRPHEVEMPGIPAEQVRWMDLPEQNIFDFPRLYVDGSSWVWKYAIQACERSEP